MALRFTCGEEKICENIKRCQNIMTSIIDGHLIFLGQSDIVIFSSGSHQSKQTFTFMHKNTQNFVLRSPRQR